MARVQPPAHQLAVARDTSSLEPRTYKVVYEAITQEKKKLHTGVRSSHPLHPTFPLLKSYIQSSFNRHPPPGFTFVLAGNPKLTARCKEYSRTEGRQIYTVSTSHKEAGTISQHVCNDLGVSITPSGHTRNSRSGNSISSSGTKKTVYAKPNNIRTRLRSKRNIHAERDPISQEQLNYEAKNALTDLFPKIPEQDLSSIISRAFKKGGKRVGNAQELSLQRRVQLAALAHIRHQYTNYDKLLRTTPRYHARAKIEETCLRLIVQWRGDGEGDESDIEQILREVIVISDDDSDHNYGTGKGNQQSRDSSVEIVSSQTIAPGARKFQISQKLSTGDHHTFELDKTPSGSHENTQGDRERKDHKRPSTKWSSRYRAFRDKYNKQGSQAEAHGQIHRHPRDIEQDRNPLDDYLSSPLIQYEVPSDTTLESPYPLIKLGSLRGPNPAKGLSANLQGQVSIPNIRIAQFLPH
ncbi:MAG: hypothetical protein M1840_006167 [Geoglossum simile]|nr:MAG: hypothetical protein M1840_006167 [Geoglossum simile]